MLWSLKLYCSRDYHKVTLSEERLLKLRLLAAVVWLIESDSTVDEERIHKMSSVLRFRGALNDRRKTIAPF